jgi:hypothetical protein
MVSIMRYTAVSVALLAMLIPATAISTTYGDLAGVNTITVSMDNVTSVTNNNQQPDRQLRDKRDRQQLTTINNQTDNCPNEDLTRFKGGQDSITIHWTGADVPHTKIAIKICFVDGDIVDRKWRKFQSQIDKNKQCKQTAEAASFLVSAFDSNATSGSTTAKLGQNVAPARYTIQVLAQNDTDYTQYGDSKMNEESMCFEVYSKDNVPTGLAVVNSIFMAVSIVYGTAVYAKYRH